MSIYLEYPHIRKLADRPAYLARFPRIRVAQIAMDQIGHGWSAEEIARQHPHLSLAEVHAALLYYLDHEQEIHEEIAHEVKEVEKDQQLGHRSPFAVRLQAKGII